MDNAGRRYGPFSKLFSGVTFLENPPDDVCPTFFGEAKAGLFCGRWSPEEIGNVFAETGCLAHWHGQGYSQIWIEIGDVNPPNRYDLEVWTQVGEYSELLMQLVVWLDYLRIERLNLVVPQFYVELLRLQSPCGTAHPQQNQTDDADTGGTAPDSDPSGAGCARENNTDNLWPGQDFPSSGMLRRMFGVIKFWASALGAEVISSIPEYFHAAWIFSEFFEYVDPEMESLFRGVVRDLRITPANLIEVSRAFVAKRVTCDGKPWLWPTEVQVYALSHALSDKLHTEVPQCTEHFEIRA